MEENRSTLSVTNINSIIEELNGYNYNNQLILIPYTQFSANISKKHKNLNDQFRVEYTTLILILSGSIDIAINYKSHQFKKNYLVVIGPGSSIQIENTSAEFMAYFLSFSETFVIDTILDRKPIPSNRFVDIKESPGTQLSEEQSYALKYSIDRIFYYMRLNEHNYIKDMLHNTFYNLILEISNIYTTIDNQQNNKGILPRKDLLMHQFVSLLHKYADKEHSPSFYSNQMCISTQYLSLILKEATGKTTSEMIATEIIARAKALLRTPGTTIVQVVDALNFADQSTFGKFFKKNTGITPKKYQESYASPK